MVNKSKFRVWALWAALAIMVAGCGYKGDLYLPEEDGKKKDKSSMSAPVGEMTERVG